MKKIILSLLLASNFSVANFERLPHDVLNEIFNSLNLKELGSLSQSSKVLEILVFNRLPDYLKQKNITLLIDLRPHKNGLDALKKLDEKLQDNQKSLKIRVRGLTLDNIEEVLAHCSKVSSLNISSNWIGDVGAQAIAKNLANLTSLNISSNWIGDVGAQAIAEMSNLESLDIFDNSIGDPGAQDIAKMSNLKSLDIGFNRIGDAGAQAIAEMSNLAWLDISGNSIGYAMKELLRQRLPFARI